MIDENNGQKQTFLFSFLWTIFKINSVHIIQLLPELIWMYILQDGEFTGALSLTRDVDFFGI